MHEAQMHQDNCFITLTYDDEHLPEDGTLVLSDWQDFAKRTRKKYKFRFYHCGEYGDINGRPHYHAAIFGLDFAHDREHLRENPQGDTLYSSATLTNLWPHGLHAIGELTFSSAAYVARYIMKKQTGNSGEWGSDPWRHYGTTVDVKPGQAGTYHTSNRFTLKPEYTTMSRSPGIGKTWIDKYIDDVYPYDEVIIRGHPSQPPKFYDDQLEKINPQLLKQMKAARIKSAAKFEEHTTYDRLAIREEVANARMQAYSREL